ncbi:MAG: hypothetical protein JWP63_7208, partial [Candidatus Solibacter sp.]|nr:hypothetical protein [Candidatus Solibacter sp.]
ELGETLSAVTLTTDDGTVHVPRNCHPLLAPPVSAVCMETSTDP